MRWPALGVEALDHNAPGIDQEKKLELLGAELTGDLFFSSSNAVTLENNIVNADGTWTRTRSGAT